MIPNELLVFYDLKRCAMHEAGHCCLSRSLGCPAESILRRTYSTIPEEETTICGITFHSGNNESNDRQKEMIGIAGFIAERLDDVINVKDIFLKVFCIVNHLKEMKDTEDFYSYLSDTDRSLLQRDWESRMVEPVEKIVSLESEIRAYAASLINQFILEDSGVIYKVAAPHLLYDHCRPTHKPMRQL